MSIGKRIEEFRKRNLDKFPKKQDLAKALHISAKQLSRYLTDERQPTAIILERLANLGCDINRLLTDKSHEELLEIIELGNRSLKAIKLMQKDMKLNSEIMGKVENLEKDIKELKKMVHLDSSNSS